jgi:mannose-1-phosphate guanylyltransferase
MRHAVILAGGGGERFWPLSRKDRPKQLLSLGGDRSLLRATFERIRTVVPADRIWVVTGRGLGPRVRSELPEIPAAHLLREPRGRNTAPALYLATLAISRQDPRGVQVVVPADAWIPREKPYQKALRAAFRLAEHEARLVLVGVRPARVETGYGYIEPGKPLSGGLGFEVRRFVEKPEAARARRMVASGRHLWNCGIFAWKNDVFAEAVHVHLPELARAFARLKQGRLTAQALDAAYRRAPSISVDYGVLERAGNAAVLPARFPWDDLGSWRALERLGKGTGFRRGRVVALESPGSIVWAEGGTVAVLGVPDVVVVHTPEATLVVPKDRAQEVRRIVSRLGRPSGRKEG